MNDETKAEVKRDAQFAWDWLQAHHFVSGMLVGLVIAFLAWLIV